MASIQEKTPGSFTVYIRKKSIQLVETFGSREDAELWACYKEDLIDLIGSFDPPLKNMITLQDAIEIRIKECEEKEIKDMGDFKILPKIFERFCPKYLNEITYADLLAYFEELMKTPVIHGGSRKNESSGLKKLPSMHTTFRKFGYLSSVFSSMIEKGVEIQNTPLKVCTFYRPLLPKKEKQL